MYNSTYGWATLGLAALAATLTLHACSANGHASGVVTVTPPLVDPITLTFTASNDGTGTFTANGGPEHAGKCATITFKDAAGNVTGTVNIQTDGNGSASGSVPPGSANWEVTVTACPEPESVEPNAGAPGGTGYGNCDPFGSQILGGSSKQGQARKSLKVPPKDHLIQGGPIVPSAAGDTNLAYCFIVKAGSLAHAQALVLPIIQGGIGSPVPPAVQVIAFAQMQANVFGGRYIQGQPGQFQSWNLDFNQGAFHADHNSALNYQLNGWDVMETVIPLPAFDFGNVPGVTYSNLGVASYSTDLLAAPVSGSYRFSFSN